MRKFLLFLLASVLWAVAPAVATDWEAGVAAFKAGDHRTAIEAFSSYVERAPDAYQGHQMLGLSLLKSGDAEAAASHLRRALELKPEDPAIALASAQASIATGDSEDACAVLSRLDPEGLSGRLRSGLLGLRAKATCDGAVESLRALAEELQTAEAWAAYGSAARGEQRFGEAVDGLGRAVELDPENLKVRRAHAVALLDRAGAASDSERMGWFELAVEPAAMVFEDEPSPSAALLYASALNGAGRNAEAAEVLEGADRSTRTLSLLGDTYLATGEYELAAKRFQAALQHAEAGSSTRSLERRLALAYEKQGLLAEAIRHYEAAGDEEGLARTRTNRQIAIDNAEADAFNKRRDEIIAQNAQAQQELDDLLNGGPPPPPR